jgi:hypothetical protein
MIQFEPVVSQTALKVVGWAATPSPGSHLKTPGYLLPIFLVLVGSCVCHKTYWVSKAIIRWPSERWGSADTQFSPTRKYPSLDNDLISSALQRALKIPPLPPKRATILFSSASNVQHSSQASLSSSSAASSGLPCSSFFQDSCITHTQGFILEPPLFRVDVSIQ